MTRLLYIIVVLVIAFSACLAPKSYQSHKQITTDSSGQVSNKNTLNESSDSSYEKPAVNHSIKITNPCDSNGNLKPGTYQTGSAKSKLVIRVVHDTVYVDCDCEASIYRFKKEKLTTDSSFVQFRKLVNERETVYKSSEQKLTAELRLWRLRFWILLILVFLVLAFLARASFIKFLKAF